MRKHSQRRIANISGLFEQPHLPTRFSMFTIHRSFIEDGRAQIHFGGAIVLALSVSYFPQRFYANQIENPYAGVSLKIN